MPRQSRKSSQPSAKKNRIGSSCLQQHRCLFAFSCTDAYRKMQSSACATSAMRASHLMRISSALQKLPEQRTLRQPHFFGSGVSFTHASSARIFSIEEYVRGFHLLCGFNESLFEDLAAAIRTACRLTQDELVWPALASHFR